MNIEEKLKAVVQQLDEKRSKVETMSAEFRSAVENADSEEALKAAQEKRSAVDAMNEEIKALEEKRSLYEAALEGHREPAKRSSEPQVSERAALNEQIRSKSAETIHIPAEMFRAGEASADPKTTGQVSANNDAIIPIQQSFVPQRELKTVTDLKPFTNVIQATTASGTQPILKNASGVLHSVEELEKNPALAKPEFSKVDWKVATYRGAIPISQENIDDSAADLVSIIAENGRQLKMNTSNAEIAKALKTFTAKTVETLDDLKKINNVDLDPAYVRSLIVSQSAYNIIDTFKDGNGRYLLMDDITSASGKSVFGMPVIVVADDVIGSKAGDAVGFLGDVKRAVLFADRADLDVQWVDNDIYGKYLRAGLRFGVKEADKSAGFYITFAPKA